MSFKTRFKILLPLCLIVVAGVLCLIIFLPGISTHMIRSAVGPLPDNLSLNFTVSHFGLHSARISDISLGEDVRLDTVQFDYRMDKDTIISVDACVISGLYLYFHLDEQKNVRFCGFSIPGEKEAASSTPSLDISAFESYAKYLPAHVVLKNSTIVIDCKKDRFYIPVTAEAQFDCETLLGNAELSMFPMNQKILISVAGNFLHGPVEMKLSAEQFRPELFFAVIPGGGQGVPKCCGPVDFAVETKDFSTFQFELNDLGVVLNPDLGVNFPKISGTLDANNTSLSLQAGGPLQIKSPGMDLGQFDLQLSSRITSGTIDQFSLTVKNQPVKVWRITPQLTALPLSSLDFIRNIQIFDPQFKLLVSGDLDHQAGRLDVFGKNLKFSENDKLKLDAAGLQVTTQFDGNVKAPDALTHIKFDAVVDKIAFKQNNSAIRAKGLHVALPVTYPFKNEKEYGRAEVKQIVVNDKISAAFSAQMFQVSDFEVDMTGKISSAQIPGMLFDFSTRAGLDSGMSPFVNAKMQTNTFLITQDTVIPFDPAISGIYNFKFDISVQSDFSYTNQTINSSADIQVANGTIKFIESGFSASGISTNMHLNDLMVPQTLPGRYLNIDRFEAGRFNCNNAKIRFSLEHGRFINVENLKFNWCNGIVSTEAFKLPSEDDIIDITLYCDRLDMKDLFYQLGAFDAEGGGTLSGRIPVVVQNTKIGFDDGFLFSTPGQGGRIYIRNLDKMLLGIPKNTREYAQLDLAGEALKNFEYNWVTLKLNSHGDTLAVNMQLDGKPLSNLPFEYNRDLNSFIRVDAQSPGANFQGIKLDVNLTLPFNQVIKFGSNLKRIINP